MPNAFVTTNPMDALKQKIFWYIGPQWFTSTITYIVVFCIVTALTSRSNVEVESSVINYPELDGLDGADKREIKSQNNEASKQIALQEERASPMPLVDIENETKGNNIIEDNYTKEQIEEMEKSVQYHGDDPIVRARLGLPPKKSN